MTEPVRNGHSIAILGAWNPRIFNPPWVAANLAIGNEVAIAIAPADPSLPMRLQFDGVFLHAGSERILLTPVQLNDPTLERMQQVAIKLLEKLPHTPISGVGVNVQYLEKSPDGQLLAAFSHGDNDALADAGAKISASSLRRALTYKSHAVNLILEQRKDGAVTIEFNFHKDAKSAADASAHVAFGLLKFRDVAGELLTAVYSPDAAKTHA